MKMPVIDLPVAAPEEFVDHARLMMDLMVIAYQADMTRVVTFMLAREGSNRSYRAIGISDGHHDCTHHQNDPEKIAKTIKINTHHVQQLAYLVEPHEVHAGWRRHAARSLDDPVRQQHLRRESPHPYRSAAGADRRRIRNSSRAAATSAMPTRRR